MTALATYQRGLIAVRKDVIRSLVPLFSTLDEAELNRSFPGYERKAVEVIREGEVKASRLAVQFYAEHRAHEHARGDAPRLPAKLASPEQLRTNLFVTGPVEVKRALAQGASMDEAMKRGQAATSGAGSRIAANAGRYQVEDLALADPSATGWQRVIQSRHPCAFCAMLASRGAVYKGGRYPPRSKYHYHCSCVVVPLFKGSKKHQQAQFYAAMWQEATKGKRGKDAVNAFRKALAAAQA